MAHRVTRRRFLKLGAAGIASAVLTGCQAPRRWVELEPYIRAPEQQLAGQATWYASTCRQCPAGCGIIVRIMNGRALKIEGNPLHPLNQGKLCARGQAGLQVLYNPDRLQGPVRQPQRGTRAFEAVAWEAGINTLYEKLSDAGPGVAVWTGSTVSHHLLDLFQRYCASVGAEPPLVYDLYTALNGYRLMSNTSQQVFGQAALPAYHLSEADVVLSFGSDFLGTWMSSVRYGIEFGEFRGQPLGKRGYFVQLEPRMTTNGAVADHWIPIRPGTEGMVAGALLRIIADESLAPPDRAAWAQSFAGTLDVGSVAAASDVAAEELEHLAHLFASAGHSVALPGASLTGTHGAAQALAAIQSLNLIGNGSSATGGLALSPSPPPGAVEAEPASYSEATSLINRMRAGEIQALLVHGANPAYDLPRKSGFVEALENVPFVASFAPIVDETAALADLILPDRTFLEAWGYALASPGFDQAAVSSQQPVVTPVFDSYSSADILLTVSRGIPAAAEALPFADEVEFLKGLVSQLGPASSGGQEPDELWASFQQHGGWWTASPPPAEPLEVPSSAPAVQPAVPVYTGETGEYPYHLCLYPSSLLSDGRGANQKWLQGSPDPMTTVSWQTWVELHPETAHEIGVQDGDIVQVSSPEGQIEAPVYVYPAIRPDTVGIPLGQGHTDYGRFARGRGSNGLELVGTQTDATGSSLAWAGLRVKISPTGKKVPLALFEFKSGVIEANIREEFPG